MTKRVEDFLWAAEQARELGFDEVNLNLGCPSGTVTAKGKGAGFLLHPDELDAFFDAVFQKVCLPVSVKTRIGYNDGAEFTRLLKIFNRYPIRELIVHPRLRGEFYKGPVHLDVFADALQASRAPVTYNGDLVSIADFHGFTEKFPTVDTVMIGRCVIADPALLRKLRGGPPAGREELKTYTQTLYQGYREAYGYPGTVSYTHLPDVKTSVIIFGIFGLLSLISDLLAFQKRQHFLRQNLILGQLQQHLSVGFAVNVLGVGIPDAVSYTHLDSAVGAVHADQHPVRQKMGGAVGAYNHRLIQSQTHGGGVAVGAGFLTDDSGAGTHGREHVVGGVWNHQYTAGAGLLSYLLRRVTDAQGLSLIHI